MNLFKKIKNARKDFLEGYRKQKNLVENINQGKGAWIYNHEGKLIEQTKLIFTNSFARRGQIAYDWMHIVKSTDYSIFISEYISDHPSFLRNVNLYTQNT